MSLPMAAVPNKRTRCVHCPRDGTTKDHVFPASWYPLSTPSNVQRWTVPSCADCNGRLGEMEKELFVRLALCVDPRKAAAMGLSEKAVRSMGVRADGISEEERKHREALKQNVLKEMKYYTPDTETFPGLGVHPEFALESQFTMPFKSEQ